MRYHRKDEPNKPLGSFLGKRMSQAPGALAMWEEFLTENKFQRFIDIGTWTGNLSLYFMLFCIQRDAEFYTYDVRGKHLKEQNRVRDLVGFSKHFELLDIFQNIEKIGGLVAKEGKTIIFCDNGYKEREFNTFAPYLKVGDIIAVHDWLTEVFPKNIQDTINKCNLKEIFSEQSDKEGMTRFFKKV